MKQLTLFAMPESKDAAHDTPHSHWKLFIDGASRNNPGNAGAGIYLLKDSEFALEQGFYLGIRTNNEAEYYALLLGLFFVKKMIAKGDTLHVISDSQLVVQQLRGTYKVRKLELKPLNELGKKWLAECRGEVHHVLRTDNVEADRMANLGVDKKLPVPQEFITVMNTNGITW